MYHKTRLLTPADVEAAGRILMRAFGVKDSFRGGIEREFAIQPEAFWITEDLTGTISAVCYDGMAYVGFMGVDPEHQRRGVARALMEKVIEELAPKYETLLLDSTDAAEPLYRQYGFEVDSLSYDCRNTTRKNEPILTIEMPEAAVRERLIAMDAEVFGMDRRKTMERLFSEPGNRTVVRNGGFLIAQESIAGPWLAPDAGVAEEVLGAALAMPEVPARRILIPQENTDAVAIVKRHGFSVLREVKHMRRGKPFPLDRRRKTYGMASFALG
jgi:ribosomal protein S18 acetylase RimI-like enzyme